MRREACSPAVHDEFVQNATWHGSSFNLFLSWESFSAIKTLLDNRISKSWLPMFSPAPAMSIKLSCTSYRAYAAAATSKFPFKAAAARSYIWIWSP